MTNALILGSYGRGNIGDDVFLLVALKFFEGRYKLYINSANDSAIPRELRGRINTIATVGSRDLFKKAKLFLSLDHIIYFGGDLWAVLHGSRFPRQSLYKMLALNTAARMFRKKIHYIGCGVGDMKGFSLLLARSSARLATSIAVREQRSASLLGLRNINVLPDLAINLDLPEPEVLSSDKFTIGVSILYHIHKPKKNFKLLVDKIAEAIAWLPQDRIKIVLIPMLASPLTHHDDLWASEQLASKLHCEYEILSTRDIGEHIKFLGSINMLIGLRLHANILSLLAGTPTIGISYRPKVEQFFHQNGLDDYCISLDTESLNNLPNKTLALYNDYESHRRNFTQASARLRQQKNKYKEYIEALF